ncbi:MAG: hypothetical protein LBU99_05830 [Spirochaetaceae bacterium]|jgi:hypothetical protein|nr:hypothetical protein [Spirochaetaceae bacterium]
MKIKKTTNEHKGITSADYKQLFHDANFAERPCFSFHYIHNKYSVTSCQERQKADLAETFQKLGSLRWVDIESSHRHGLGSEKIARNAIIPAIPESVPKDTALLAIRFSGKAPMIGFRERNIFHIVFLDHNFTVYSHE